MKTAQHSFAIDAMNIKPIQEYPIRVMLVDDSAVMRSLIKTMLEKETDILVSAAAIDGNMAISHLARHDVEVVLLDLKMPNMDGLTALPELLKIRPDLQIIMVASIEKEDTNDVLRAMELGAVDCLSKPTHSEAIHSGFNFKGQLIEKIRSWGSEARKRQSHENDIIEQRRKLRESPLARKSTEPLPVSVPSKPIVLRNGSIPKPDAIAIGSSTGGPQALFKVVSSLGNITQPVFITQHMPPTFTAILADHLTKIGTLPCVEAKDGMLVDGGKMYLAPGDFHMTVMGSSLGKIIRLNKDAHENFCRPAVDPMLRSLAAQYGGNLFIVILTGMGSDGRNGGDIAIKAGASMIAQDQVTSVVWGMPGAVAQAGLCHDVLPLDEIGPYIASVARMGRPA